MELVGLWKRGESLDAILKDADVLIDFSLPDATDAVIASARRSSTPLVCGVSGLADPQIQALRALSEQVAVVYDRNMSQGIAVLRDIVARVATSLGAEFGVEIHETHHVHKLDAPSGTALQLAEAVADGQGVEASAADIKFQVERQGEVPGDHSVIWSSPAETLTLAHSVTSRDVFAAGALHAARWASGRSAGFYSMHDVLFSDK
jgi:4-hydroxy-tetrahydrodipicolinate reductase